MSLDPEHAQQRHQEVTKGADGIANGLKRGAQGVAQGKYQPQSSRKEQAQRGPLPLSAYVLLHPFAVF